MEARAKKRQAQTLESPAVSKMTKRVTFQGEVQSPALKFTTPAAKDGRMTAVEALRAKRAAADKEPARVPDQKVPIKWVNACEVTAPTGSPVSTAMVVRSAEAPPVTSEIVARSAEPSGARSIIEASKAIPQKGSTPQDLAITHAMKVSAIKGELRPTNGVHEKLLQNVRECKKFLAALGDEIKIVCAVDPHSRLAPPDDADLEVKRILKMLDVGGKN